MRNVRVQESTELLCQTKPQAKPDIGGGCGIGQCHQGSIYNPVVKHTHGKLVADLIISRNLDGNNLLPLGRLVGITR